MQQLQFWRRGSSSKDMEPVEAPKPKHTAEPDEATTAAPQAGREQDGALDDVDALMAQLAERQVSHHATHVAAPPQKCDAAYHPSQPSFARLSVIRKC